MCRAHYARWRRGAALDVEISTRHQTPEESFLARIEPLAWSSCLVWMGAIDSGGHYGQVSIGGKLVAAHRYAWERVNGPVPAGMFVDHTCWVRSCVNVEHLRLATRAQNNRNRQGASRNSRTGVRGVRPRRGGYEAQVRCHGTSRSKHFKTLDAAAEWAAETRLEMYGEYAGGD